MPTMDTALTVPIPHPPPFHSVSVGAVLLDGIFFDEMTNDCNYDTYYANLTAYVKSKDAGALVIGNPGTASVTCPGGSTGSEVTWAASVRFNCCLRGKRG